jgi:hypothetical protein
VVKITHCRITPAQLDFGDPPPQVIVRVDNGREEILFSYFADELSFKPEEFIGLTKEEGKALFHRKDVEYLRS